MESTIDKVKNAIGQGVEATKLAVQDPDVAEAANREGTSLGTKMEKGLEKGAQLAETTAKKIKPDVMTTLDGKPLGDNYNSISAGKLGPLLLTEDINLYEKNAALNRERTVPRVVHAKGVGAFGTFTVTNSDMAKYSEAKVFQPGKSTEMFCRWSGVTAEHGNADSVRDIRGMALKFYTEDGNWDLVGNNSPIFFFRDPVKFPDLVHSLMRDPRGLKSWVHRWDFWGLTPESVHQVLWLFGDRGIPKNYRHMNGYGVHAFALINEKKERVWVKYHLHSQQEIENLTSEQGIDLAGKDPDYFNKDMINSIRAGSYPKWKMFIQVMTEQQADELSHDPFDITKVWSRHDFPLIEVGDLEFNKIPDNYFQDVEQAAFAPANIVPGMGFSPDRLLQARLFAYRDAHNHRLGINGFQVPVNQPKCPIHTYHRDGALRLDGNGGLGPHYEPNSFGGPQPDPKYADPAIPIKVSGDGARYENHYGKDDMMHAKALWEMFEPDEQERVIKNIASSMKEGTEAGVNSEYVPELIQQINLYNFARVDDDLGKRLAAALDLDLDDAMSVGKKTLDQLYGRQTEGTIKELSPES